MKLMFIGAAHEVTGSCHYLEAAGKHMLVDYGMEQGADVYQNADLPVPESQIDYVFLTHAHVPEKTIFRVTSVLSLSFSVSHTSMLAEPRRCPMSVKRIFTSSHTSISAPYLQGTN